MRKLLFFLLVIAVGALGLFYTLSNISYDYYIKAKALYEQGKYKEAYEMLDIGSRKDPYNRKIISLKGKVYPIVQGRQDLKEAQQLYEDAINLALQGQVDNAKIKMSRAYDLAFKIGSASGVRADAQELIRKINRDAPLVLDSAQETRYRNAIKQETEGNLERAYQILANIDVKNEKIRRKMSNLAFHLGERRYKQIKIETKPNAGLVNDAIYWYSQVQPFDDNFLKATQIVNKLKVIKTD